MSLKVGDLFVQLGISADSAKVKDFAKALGNLTVDAAAAIVGLAGVQYKLAQIANEAMNVAVGFQQFTAQTGLSWRELQKWQIVAEQANVSAESVASSVGALQRNLAEIRLGGGNIAPFQMLGINANQSAFGVLQQLRGAIKGLDNATATNMISQMGINPEMMELLTLSDEKFKELSKTVVGMNQAQSETFLKAKESLVQFGLQARYIGFGVVANLVNGFTALKERLFEIRGVLPVLGAAFAAAALYFAPITASIALLLLALEDLAVYFAGGKSVTGLAVEGLKKLASIDFKNMNGFTKAISSLGPVAAMIASANPLTSGVATAAKLIQMSNKIDIAVHGSASADETAKAVKKEFDKSVNEAALQTDKDGK